MADDAELEAGAEGESTVRKLGRDAGEGLVLGIGNGVGAVVGLKLLGSRVGLAAGFLGGAAAGGLLLGGSARAGVEASLVGFAATLLASATTSNPIALAGVSILATGATFESS